MQKIVIRPKQDGQKTAMVVRYGAWGDYMMMAPVLRYLHNDGYHVIFNLTERCHQLARTDPHVDEFWLQQTNEIENGDLAPHWAQLAKQVDRFINLSGSIEGDLLKVPNQLDPLSGEDQYNWPKQRIHEQCDRNYFDYTMEKAGYPEAKGLLGELYLTSKEKAWAQEFKAKYAPRFMVVIGLGGSAAHKAYPYMSAVGNTFLDIAPDAVIVTVGDGACQYLEWDHPRVIKKSAQIGIRKSLALTQAADLVVAPETAIVHAAACIDVPKVTLLSHSSEENLTKYWTNCTAVYQPVQCYPCHKLHYTLDCPLVEEIKAPVCMGLLHPNKILEPMERYYNEWLSRQRQQTRAS